MQLPMGQVPAGERLVGDTLRVLSRCLLLCPPHHHHPNLLESHGAATCQCLVQQNSQTTGQLVRQAPEGLSGHQHLTEAHPATLTDSS